MATANTYLRGNVGVDVVRAIAIVAVISLHTHPLAGGEAVFHARSTAAVALNQLARFAVPFFFVVSGYFWGMRIHSRTQPLSAACISGGRVLLAFLGWSTVYLVVDGVSAAVEYGPLGFLKGIWWGTAELLDDPVNALSEGPKVHLWFLLSMAWALALSGAVLQFWGKYLLLAMAILLYVIGVLAKSYSDTPFGIALAFNTRNGPFFSLLPFVSGYILSERSQKQDDARLGIVLMVLGFLLQAGELTFLHQAYGTAMEQDYVFGTYVFGLGAALIGLSNVAWLRIDGLAWLGRYTLGIYAIHYAFVDLLRPMGRVVPSPLWDAAYPALALSLSLGLAMLVARIRPLRKLVL